MSWRLLILGEEIWGKKVLKTAFFLFFTFFFLLCGLSIASLLALEHSKQELWCKKCILDWFCSSPMGTGWYPIFSARHTLILWVESVIYIVVGNLRIFWTETSVGRVWLRVSLFKILFSGVTMETVEHMNIKFSVWDVERQQNIRPLWRHYYQITRGKSRWTLLSNSKGLWASNRFYTRSVNWKWQLGRQLANYWKCIWVGVDSFALFNAPLMLVSPYLCGSQLSYTLPLIFDSCLPLSWLGVSCGHVMGAILHLHFVGLSCATRSDLRHR